MLAKLDSRTAMFALAIGISLSIPVVAADRTTLFIPLGPDADTIPLVDRVFADAAYGDEAGDSWSAYLRLWKAHYDDPGELALRKFFGFPLKGNLQTRARRGQSAPAWLNWRRNSFAQIETNHFTILSRADKATSMRVALDLERCYWAWTQMFFPLWIGSGQVTSALKGLRPDQSVAEFLTQNPARLKDRRTLRVVLFRDKDEYIQTLDIPGIERSTGFYSDERQTTCLFASAQDDPATRRHEIVHQLFREATRSRLGQEMPGEESGFWLVEGIAGYFESLFMGDSFATVGGWDSSRLQFARYRILVGDDPLRLAELRHEGRLATQRRPDLARWYAHVITHTHCLMDSGDLAGRRWMYDQLVALYQIRNGPKADNSGYDYSDDAVRRFLAIDDKVIEQNKIDRDLKHLCLAGCTVTTRGLSLLPVSPNMQRLDLSRLPIGNDDVVRLVPDPGSLHWLSLEGTQVNGRLGEWLSRATGLQELDLSWTAADDSLIEAVAGAKELGRLWLTGSRVAERSIDAIAKMPALESVDLQRTQVQPSGIARLKNARPKIEINELVLQDPR